MQPAVPDAARLAHSVRNYLTVIGGFAELLLAEVTDPVQRELVAEIGAAVTQATTFTARHLASTSGAEHEPIDLTAHVSSTEASLRALVGAAVSLRVVYPIQPLYVRIAPTALDDVLMNLAANARDAMPLGGSLAIRLEVADECAGRPGGSWCRIAVADTGHGLSAEAAERVFEPFFTTRPGTGTGIGLCEVQQILVDAGGSITAGPSAGGGTEFVAHLPLADHVGAPVLRLPVRSWTPRDRPGATTETS